jgi:regulator of nucleoside diphosphate kinase
MHDHYPTILSTRVHDRLQAMMCSMIGARTPLASLVRHKLGSAIVMLEGDVGPDVVVPGRRVRFTIGGYQTKERALTWEPHVRGDRRNVSLLVPRGLALLGLRVGESISYRTATRYTEFVQIDHVFPDDGDGVPHGEPTMQRDASFEAEVHREDLLAHIVTLA